MPGLEEYVLILPQALSAGVSAVEIKETVYQSVAYLGIGKVLPFLRITNEIFAACGVAELSDRRSFTTPETRTAAGEQVQVDIFGESMCGFLKTGRDTNGFVNAWLSDNCFGDYYSRRSLNYRRRGMITLCFLAAQRRFSCDCAGGQCDVGVCR